MGGSGGVARRAGRAFVLAGAVLLLARNVLWYARIELPALQEVLADVLLRGPEGTLSGEVGRLRTYELLGEALIDAYLLCVTVLAPLLLRGAGRARWAPSRRTSSASPSPSYAGAPSRGPGAPSWPLGCSRSWRSGACEGGARRRATGGPQATSRRWASRSSRGSTSTSSAMWWVMSSTRRGWPSRRGMPWTGRGWPCAWPFARRGARPWSPSCSEASPSTTATTGYVGFCGV